MRYYSKRTPRILGDKMVPNEKVGKVGTIYNMNLQAYIRKQVKMHMTTKIIAEI